MKRLIFTTVCTLFIGYHSVAQDLGEKVLADFAACDCREIIMNTRGAEKSYTGVWLENIALEDGFIVFAKGDYKHMWAAEKISFIEKGHGFMRVYLE